MAFGKKEKTLVPTGGDSILKPTMFVSGDIVMHGPLYLDCKVDGSVTGNDNSRLVIGPRAAVKGNIKAASIEVFGSIIGDVDCRSIKIHPKAYIQGNIVYQIIEMQSEAMVEGEMHNRSNSTDTINSNSTQTEST